MDIIRMYMLRNISVVLYDDGLFLFSNGQRRYGGPSLHNSGHSSILFC